jgi:hypothetical protein
MEATGSVIKKMPLFRDKIKCHRCFKNIWEVNGPNLRRMPVDRMVGEIFAVS